MLDKIPCVYILTNKRNGTLYTGVTSNLQKRLAEHRSGAIDGFTKQYKVHILVYYEVCEDMHSAIAKEKKIKGGSRKRKLNLIEEINLTWRDLCHEV
jgi:putative endonuclease